MSNSLFEPLHKTTSGNLPWGSPNVSVNVTSRRGRGNPGDSDERYFNIT